jgi:hypothetical protein
MAIPFTPILLILQSLSRKEKFPDILKDLLILMIAGFIVFIIGNPTMWNMGRAAQAVSSIRGVQEFQTIISESLLNMITNDFDYYLFRLMTHLVTYPVGLFIEFYLVQLFVIIILGYSLFGKVFRKEQIFTLEWILAIFLTLSMINKSIVIGGWIVNYYAIHLLPPLSLFCSLSFSDELEKRSLQILGRLKVISVDQTRKKVRRHQPTHKAKLKTIRTESSLNTSANMT